MSEANHDRVADILRQALRTPASRRQQVVADACVGDAALRRSVESLLSLYDSNPLRSPDESVSPTTYSPDDETSPSAREPHQPPDSGRTWGGFVLLEELGRGGFGVVYRAWDAVLKRDVALKIINARRLRAADDDAVLREGQLMARVRHENVVTVFSAQRIGDEIGLAMEYIKGRTLAGIVSEGGPLGAHEAALIGIRLCDALTAVHRLGLVHRDLKASNVMRESGGRIVLMDFGAGRDLGTDAAGRPEILGTPLYMPPELLLGSRGTAASDIYSLGVLLYNLVTGTYPIGGTRFDDLRLAHIGGERQSLAEQRSDLPDAFVAAVDKALSPDPSRRQPSAVALKRELAEAIGSLREPPPVRPRGRAPLPAPKTDRQATTIAPQIARRPLDVLMTIAGRIAAGGAACIALGFLTTMAFNTTLGRSGEFANESVWAYLVWGARALVGPVVWMLLIVMVVSGIRFVGRLVARAVPAAARLGDRLARSGQRLSDRLGFADVTTRLQALTILGLALIAVFGWAFRDLISAYTSTITDAPARVLQPLTGDYADNSWSYDLRVLYRRSFEVVILIVGVPMWQMLRRPEQRRAASPSAIAGCAAVLVISVVMLVAPWRVMFKAQFPVARLDAASCYVLGESAARVLVHCPELAPPRNRIVAADDPRLQRGDTIATVFNAYRGAAPRTLR